MNWCKILFLPLFLVLSCTSEDIPVCRPNSEVINYPIIAHSHNDYEQDFPIRTALHYGFTSLEVDIVYDGYTIRVSHDEDDLSRKPSFEFEYLQKIIAHISTIEELILFIDIKKYSYVLLSELNSVLENYATKLVSRENPHDNKNKIKIILSGDIPRTEIANNSQNKFLFIDGRFEEESLMLSSDITPVISINAKDFTNGNLKNEALIRKIIGHIHDNGKRVRFWNTNDDEDVWLKLIEMNIDIIGVDNIEKFCTIMQKNGYIN